VVAGEGGRKPLLSFKTILEKNSSAHSLSRIFSITDHVTFTTELVL